MIPGTAQEVKVLAIQNAADALTADGTVAAPPKMKRCSPMEFPHYTVYFAGTKVHPNFSLAGTPAALPA